MSEVEYSDGIVAGRLAPDAYARNFGDLHPPLDRHEAVVEADRCYFCHDAPCVTACPTQIDIPLFIRQIGTGNPAGAAKTIFDQNIFGGMCARVCPTETLCEQACVREEAEGRPVRIGRLQRYATDLAMKAGTQFYSRATGTGRTIAVVGAGPAGLACAHRLAVLGHQVTVLEARSRPGGLNEYGIAAYKTTDGFAEAEVAYITAVGGITIIHDKALGRDYRLSDLTANYDAVFLGLGLGAVNAIGVTDDEAAGVSDAIDFIATLRQADDLSALAVGRRIVVIGGGMTAIDVAIQAKLLGSEEVTICYRRGKAQMNASRYEQDLAAAKGVVIRHWLRPSRMVTEGGRLCGIELEYTALADGRLVGTGRTLRLQADQVFRAIGQRLDTGAFDDSQASLAVEGGRIRIDEEGRTSMARVWAGGDCVGGNELTVTAVAGGRDAAQSIHRTLLAEQRGVAADCAEGG